MDEHTTIRAILDWHHDSARTAQNPGEQLAVDYTLQCALQVILAANSPARMPFRV